MSFIQQEVRPLPFPEEASVSLLIHGVPLKECIARQHHIEGQLMLILLRGRCSLRRCLVRAINVAVGSLIFCIRVFLT